MPKKERANTIAVLNSFYVTHAAGFMSHEAAENSFRAQGITIDDGTLASFAKKFPDADMQAVTDFAKACNVYVTKETKLALPVKRQDKERALALGCPPELLDRFVEIIGIVKPLHKELAGMLPKGQIVFALVNKKVADAKDVVDSQNEKPF